MLQPVGKLARFSWRAACKVVSAATGVILILSGVGLLGWVGFILFIEELPEAKGRDPWGAIKFSVLLIAMGIVFVRH